MSYIYKLIERARKLAGGATPGPWYAEDTWCSTAINCSGDVHVAMSNLALGKEQCDANAVFIAACRDIVPALAYALSAMIHERNALRDACLDISAVVIKMCGDDDEMVGEPLDYDLASDYAVKAVFGILEKLDKTAPGWNIPPEFEEK